MQICVNSILKLKLSPQDIFSLVKILLQLLTPGPWVPGCLSFSSEKPPCFRSLKDDGLKLPCFFLDLGTTAICELASPPLRIPKPQPFQQVLSSREPEPLLLLTWDLHLHLQSVNTSFRMYLEYMYSPTISPNPHCHHPGPVLDYVRSLLIGLSALSRDRLVSLSLLFHVS